ncbi:MAG: hypothetical protein CVU55_05655 [Deltaproteobacteria bacterium HGW-Deltaproteobacteria-13]|nr:MAG: hypothetical protein CVU55_05655 [Deltaproteobacteria bacterium HGW-Deltaproteobacteria-13]
MGLHRRSCRKTFRLKNIANKIITKKLTDKNGLLILFQTKVIFCQYFISSDNACLESTFWSRE